MRRVTVFENINKLNINSCSNLSNELPVGFVFGELVTLYIPAGADNFVKYLCEYRKLNERCK